MKRNFLILLISLLIITCSKPSKQNIKTSETRIDSVNETTIISNPEKTAAESIKLPDSIVELYSGYWLNNDFLTQIEINKSVFDSKEYDGELFGFELDKTGLKTGETKVYGFTSHEGGYVIPIRWIDEFRCFTSTGFEDEISSIKMDVVIDSTNIIEFQFEDGTSEFYRKVSDQDSELRKILFKGIYEDSLANKYSFNTDGDISGFGGKNHYTVLYDFGEGLYYDVIFISENGNQANEDLYHYRINQDSLLLYEIKGEVPEYKIGELKYKLVKSKSLQQ
ncbi:hypothetical protein [Marinigracilibium pacificum]|uniref:Uncharacterized protein n=1 Tax=Marinigracilibium pacificum TaxID=2729599 RepID=A0A848J5B2_9BACT|nr:hypothetical protein [Marinigracilibium pacificum]NMM50896.1 hypothetical protein [Marinigracilibium pacificum]